MRRSKELKLKILLVILSLIVGLLICEIIVRFVRPTSDIFPQTRLPTKYWESGSCLFIQATTEMGSATKRQKDISPVCIGDSMIYGVGVRRRYAIPQQLSRLMYQRAYNMGLGSYGPVQYYQLLKSSRAMHPQKTIISFFLGNDLLDAADIVSNYNYWKGLTKTLGPEQHFFLFFTR